MKVLRVAAIIAVALMASASKTLRADEGMWTFDRPPVQSIQSRYGFTITQPWLDHLRLASVRFPDGSGSFVSPTGLVLTNHHVALGAAPEALDGSERLRRRRVLCEDARRRSEGGRCRTQRARCRSEDVTSRVTAAAARATANAQAALDARNAEIARIEKECVDTTKLRCDVVTLYQGAQYWLYRYKKYTDVRLVFAPEQQMAFFGGDPDNFTYPRLRSRLRDLPRLRKRSASAVRSTS